MTPNPFSILRGNAFMTWKLTSPKTELERLDVFHQMFLVARGDKLYSAPIGHLQNPRILDLGCGTGIWGIDMAE